jgi:DUF1009 family protein
VGPKTLRICAASRISALALESGKTLLLEQETCEKLAKENSISIVTVG